MKKTVLIVLVFCFSIISIHSTVYSFSIFGGKPEELTPINGVISIPVEHQSQIQPAWLLHVGTH